MAYAGSSRHHIRVDFAPGQSARARTRLRVREHHVDLLVRKLRVTAIADERGIGGHRILETHARDDVATRAVLIVNPGNPAGNFLKRDEAGKLLDLCKARGLALISDEVFSDFGFGDDPMSVRQRAS